MTFLLLIQLLIAPFLPNSEPGLEISGTVINEGTRQPVDKAYIYTVKGEEEAISDGSGNFHFTTWKEKPVRIYISHVGFKSKVVDVNEGFKNIKIILAQK